MMVGLMLILESCWLLPPPARSFQEEVCSMINQRYVEFLPSVQSAKDLESQVQELSAGIDQLRSRIENEVRTVWRNFSLG